MQAYSARILRQLRREYLSSTRDRGTAGVVEHCFPERISGSHDGVRDTGLERAGPADAPSLTGETPAKVELVVTNQRGRNVSYTFDCGE